MRWFVTGPYAVRMPDGRFAPASDNVVHAKEIGTVLTACGQWTATWHRFWDVPFLAVRDLRRCPDCLDVVLGDAAAQGSSRRGPTYSSL